MFGDPFILEVDGQSSDYLDGSAAYNVLRVFTDSNLLDVFLKFSDYFSVVQPKVIVVVVSLDLVQFAYGAFMCLIVMKLSICCPGSYQFPFTSNISVGR